MTEKDTYTPESSFPLSEDLTDPDDTYTPESSFPLSDNLGLGSTNDSGGLIQTDNSAIRQTTPSAVVKTEP